MKCLACGDEMEDVTYHSCCECGRGEWCGFRSTDPYTKIGCRSWHPIGCLPVEGEEVRGFDGELFWESKEREE